MLAEVLEDPVLRVVFRKSHFKPSQLDSLLVKRYARERKMKTREVLRLRDAPSSAGAFHRSASQAEVVISKSVATMLLALNLNLVDQNVVNAIMRVALVIGGTRDRSLTQEELASVQGLVGEFIERSSHQ